MQGREAMSAAGVMEARGWDERLWEAEMRDCRVLRCKGVAGSREEMSEEHLLLHLSAAQRRTSKVGTRFARS